MNTYFVMVFEKFIRYAGLAVGLKPSATECEARLRGLERIIIQRPRKLPATGRRAVPRASARRERPRELRAPTTSLRIPWVSGQAAIVLRNVDILMFLQ